MEHLDERFLVISGDVITDIDLDARSSPSTTQRGAMATIGLVQVDNPLEFGIVITREDGTIERFLEKPTWGQVFSDTINTGIYVLEPDGLRLHRRRAGRSTSPATCSRSCWPTASRCSAPSPRATGRTSAPSRPTCSAHKDVLDQRVLLDIPGFRISDGVWLGEGAEVSPDAARRRAGGDRRRAARSRPAAGSASTSCSARTYGCSAGRRPRAHASCTTTPTSAPGARIRGTVIGRASNLRANVRCDEGVVLGDEVFVGEQRRPQQRRQGLPVQDDRGRRRRQLVASSGRAGARARLFGRDGVTGLANVDVTPELAAKVAMAYGTSLPQGHHRGDVARLEPLGPHAEAGDDGRPQRVRRRTCSTSRWPSMPGDPLPRAFAARRSAASRSGCTSTTPTAWSCASSTRPAPTSPRTPSARSSACSSGRTTGGCCPRRSATSPFPPRALEDYTVALEATVDIDAIRGTRFKLVRRPRLRRHLAS